jgi:hypothetical protein
MSAIVINGLVIALAASKAEAMKKAKEIRETSK